MKTYLTRRGALAVLLAVVLSGAAVLATGCGTFPNSSTSGTASSSLGAARQSPAGYAADKAVSPIAPTSGESAAGGTANTALPSSTEAARMVVRTVSMRLKVEDVNATAKKVGALATATKGYVEAMQISTDSGSPVYAPVNGDGTSSGGSTALSGYVTVRLPAASLEQFRKDVAGLGTVVFESTDSQDVTAQNADLEARLKNLQATESGLRRLFDKAKTVNEMLAIQNQLTQVQGEIESLTAQIKVLNDQAAMSTVTVQLVGPEAIVSPAGESWGFMEALRTSVRAFVGTINVMIVALGALLPLIVIVALFVWLVVALVKRSAKKKAASQAAAAEAPSADLPAAEETADAANDPTDGTPAA